MNAQAGTAEDKDSSNPLGVQCPSPGQTGHQAPTPLLSRGQVSAPLVTPGPPGHLKAGALTTPNGVTIAGSASHHAPSSRETRWRK